MSENVLLPLLAECEVIWRCGDRRIAGSSRLDDDTLYLSGVELSGPFAGYLVCELWKDGELYVTFEPGVAYGQSPIDVEFPVSISPV